MTSILKKCPLFTGLSSDEIENCLQSSHAEVITVNKDDWIFQQGDIPRKLMVLLEGAVVIGNDSSYGKRSIIAALEHPGELFGEIFLFLNKQVYENYAQAIEPSKILQIPKEFLYHAGPKDSPYHDTLILNMLSIFAQKAYYLNRKLQIISYTTLRQKIAKIFLHNCSDNGQVTLSMSREELADFLNTARPSLSRELMRMQEDGLIRIDKRKVFIPDRNLLQSIL